jgi:hypothetical protein
MNKYDILPSIQSNNNFSVLNTRENNNRLIDLNGSSKANSQSTDYNGKPDFHKSKTLMLPPLNQDLINNQLNKNKILPTIAKNLISEEESFIIKRSNKLIRVSTEESSDNNELNIFNEEGKFKKRLKVKYIFQSTQRQSQSELSNDTDFNTDLDKRNDNSGLKTYNNSQNLKTTVKQTGSPYFWYYRDKSKISPDKDKDYSSPPLFSYKIYDSIEKKSLDVPINAYRNLNESKTKKKIQKNPKENLNVNKDGKNGKQSQVNDSKNNNKNEKDQQKSKFKLSEKYTCRPENAKINLPFNVIRRLTVTSAKLRNLALSEKFIKEAKSLVYSKESHSLFPITAFEYLFHNDPINFKKQLKFE